MNYEETKQQVIDMLCAKFKITQEKMFSRTRKRECSDARNFFSLWVKENTKLSLSKIGKEERPNPVDHTTIISNLKSAKALMQTDIEFKYLYQSLPRYIPLEPIPPFPSITAMAFRSI